ncbi:MAG: hypothetical protein AAB229_05440 [Candidatus Hydrogenedentota bacterium]
MANVEFKIGHIVRLKQPCLGNPAGALGVCYEKYRLDDRWGASFIFENGEYDGFSDEDAGTILVKAGFEPHVAKYRFTNVIQLSRDFAAGRFASALSGELQTETIARES